MYSVVLATLLTAGGPISGCGYGSASFSITSAFSSCMSGVCVNLGGCVGAGVATTSYVAMQPEQLPPPPREAPAVQPAPQEQPAPQAQQEPLAQEAQPLQPPPPYWGYGNVPPVIQEQPPPLGPPPPGTRLANIIAPFILCGCVRSNVPPRPCACCGCCGITTCWGCGYCGCCKAPRYNGCISPYAISCCGCYNSLCFANCGGVVIAQVYGSCYANLGCGCMGYGGVVVPGVPVPLHTIPSQSTVPAPEQSAPEQPAPEQQRRMPKASDSDGEPASTAQVTIKAPVEVRVLVNGQPTQRQGTETTFVTPELKAGKTYSYTFQAELAVAGQTAAQTRKVLVRAGERTVVDFNDLQRQQPPPAVDVSRVALVTLSVPEDAKLFVDGANFNLPGKERTFTTPSLEPGKKHFYELKAQVVRDGQVQTETHKVYVEPGQHIRVNFKELAEIRTASK